MKSRAFMSWLADNYPEALVDAVYQAPQRNRNASDMSSSFTSNGLAYDNLYVDMKWIIHPLLCTEAKPVSMKFSDVVLRIYDDIDQLYAMVQPRKLLYLAVDGVLPRLKTNMHRVHCFQAAKDAGKSLLREDKLHEELGTLAQIPPFQKKNQLCDPNVFSPGTELMATLTTAIKYYICLRINQDPRWQTIKVVFSDASIPGDAKHKIMSYIRLQRDLPGYDANTHHCLFGLDLDSLMMALATHEVHFSILHKKLNHATQHSCSVGICNVGKNPEQNIVISGDSQDIVDSGKSYQLLHIWILREYLENALFIPDAPGEINFEQLIDDFVFLALLCTSNFLPQIPILDIQEGAMTLLMDVYKKEFVKMGGYLTDAGEANLRRIEHFMQVMGTFEKEFVEKFLNHVKTDTVDHCSTAMLQNSPVEDSKVVEVLDYSWKERYYAAKFHTHKAESIENLKGELVLKYTEGLLWILRYYYHGVCSWKWYYPYYDAPLASDLKELEDLEINFFQGKPLKPFDYLMALLPISSADLLPKQYKPLMTDPNSPIRDFYLQDFEADIYGKHSTSSGVVRLPFIDETRLLAETSKLEQLLLESERTRNQVGVDFLFLFRSHPLATYILDACPASGIDQHGTEKKEIDPVISEGMNGFVILGGHDLCAPTVISVIDGMADITNNQVLCIPHEGPATHRHRAMLMEGVIMPQKVVAKEKATLDMSRGLQADIGEPDSKSRQCLEKDLKDKTSNSEEAFRQLHKQHSISGCESLPSILSREYSLQLKARKAGPPGFEHVVPGYKLPIAPANWGQIRTPNGNLISSKSLPSPMDNSPQYLKDLIELRSLSPGMTSSLSSKRTSSGNVRAPMSQVSSSNRSPNQKPDQGYSIPTFLNNLVGSSAMQCHNGMKKNATKPVPASQVGQSVTQYPGFTPSSSVSSPILSNNISTNKSIPNNYTRTGESPELIASQYPPLFPQGGYPNGNFGQMMTRLPPTAPPACQGFSGFSRGLSDAQHVPRSPHGYSQQPGTMPPRAWYKERELEPSPPPLRSQQAGAGHYPFVDNLNRPENFARGKGTGIRHPDNAFR